MSNTSRRGFFRTVAASIAALAASRAVSALPIPVAPLPRGDRTHAALKEMLGEDKYLSWFYAMRVGTLDGATLHASVPVKFIENWINYHYAPELLAAARTEFPGIERVRLTARDAKPTRFSAPIDGWQPMETAPHDGTLVALLCEWEENRGDRVTLARWDEEGAKESGPHGAFGWKVVDGFGASSIAEDVPIYWLPIPEDPDGMAGF